jgi:hypothetical protein
LAGTGTSAAINQKITFTIKVPPQSSTSASVRRTAAGARRAAAAATPPPPPYLSPATAAIVLTLAEIDGTSPKQAPPVIPAIPVTCQNCTFSVPNIPAALGLNEYYVQTYSGYANGQATGNLISSGFVDVSVPLTTSPVLGGAPALSIGGYVANISLTPQTVDFLAGAAGNQDLQVSALDAGGATIIGKVQFVTPISISVINAQSFALNGAASLSLTEPLAAPITLHYTGSGFSTLVDASSIDENGNSVNASIEALVVPPPTPTPLPGQTPPPPTPAPSPTPLPSPTLPPKTTSLYVADGQTDTVSEYGFVEQLEAGSPPNPVPTPRRVMQFSPSLVTGKIPTLACSSSPLNPPPNQNEGNGTSGVTVTSSGTIFTFPTCQDGLGNVYIFGFPPTSVGLVAPTLLDPIGGAAISDYPEALAYNATNGNVFGELTDFGEANPIAGFSPTSTGQQPSIFVGQTCYQEFGQRPCDGNSNGFSFGAGFNGANGGFGVDANGFAYVPAYWTDTPTGDASNLDSPAAILTVPVVASSSTTVLQTALTGLNSLAGSSLYAPISAVVDGSILYVLTGTESTLSNINNLIQYYPGVSSCPPPSSNAAVNALAVDAMGNDYPVQCYGGPNVNTVDSQAMYVVAYTIGAGLLGGIGDVDLTPQFVIGGDVVGNFGCGQNAGAFLAASAGYVYVINQYPPSNPYCTTGSGNPTPEIDVYNTNGLVGVHTDIAPVVKINLSTAWPMAMFIGPSGSVTGGQALLRAPTAPSFRHAMYHGRPLRNTHARFRRRPPYRWAVPSPIPTPSQ